MYLILFLFCRLFLKPTESWFVSNSYLRFALIYNVLVIWFYRGGFTLSHVILMFLLQWLMTGNRFLIAVSLMNPPMLMDLLCQRTDLQSLYTMWWLVNWRTNCHSRGFTPVVGLLPWQNKSKSFSFCFPFRMESQSCILSSNVCFKIVNVVVTLPFS